VEPLRKTLIIRFSSIGDVVLSSLLVRVMRHRFPESQIDYLVKAEFADLVRYNPHLSHVIEFPPNGTFADLRDLRRRLRAARYDLIVDIHDSLRSRFLCLGAQRVVRIYKRKAARFLLVKFKWNLYPWFGGAPSVAERYLESVAEFGVTDDRAGLDLFLPPAAENKVRELLLTAGLANSTPLLALCPSAKHRNKIWLPDRFAEAAVSCAREFNVGIILFGSGEEDEARAEEIEHLIRARAPDTKLLNVTGSISLLETAALMDRCALVITNDSGLMHIAAARKRRTVAIFGPTVREFGFFPFGTDHAVVQHDSLACRPCTSIGLPVCPEGHFKCMKDIPVTRVIAATRQLLNN
jgi:lipopolysaccharide heptosyltransferase II